MQIRVRARLMCVNAPESRGKNKTAEGVAMADYVKGLHLTAATIEPVKSDAFGRSLAYVRPAGWDQTLNRHLHEIGAPLYDKLTRKERAECQARFR